MGSDLFKYYFRRVERPVAAQSHPYLTQPAIIFSNALYLTTPRIQVNAISEACQDEKSEPLKHVSNTSGHCDRIM